MHRLTAGRLALASTLSLRRRRLFLVLIVFILFGYLALILVPIFAVYVRFVDVRTRLAI